MCGDYQVGDSVSMKRGLLSYLVRYGNTKESDLMEFGAKKFCCLPQDIRDIISKMVANGKIHYIVHNKLEPHEVYISLMKPLPPRIMRALIDVSVAKNMEIEAHAIIKEASLFVEKLIKEEDSQRKH